MKEMDIVGVGGAALLQNVGDDLVEQGVNLVSRFGSAEYGFLMSLHRNYAKEKEWQYLRSDISLHLKFEPQEGLAELVILSTWPHMAKTNRDECSYNTADLFALHPTIPNAWKFHSRADSQLTLITGKKFDPTPLEAAIATSPLVEDVLIFGNGQKYPGALLFRSPQSAGRTNEEFTSAVWPSIEKLNAESQGHTRVPSSTLVVMPKDSILQVSRRAVRALQCAVKLRRGMLRLSCVPMGLARSYPPMAVLMTKRLQSYLMKICQSLF